MLKRPAVALLIAVFLAIVIFAAGYFLLIGPKKGTIDSKQKEIEKTENLIVQEKGTYNQLVDIKNRSAEFEARLASVQAMIPAEPELPSLIRNIQAAADPGTGAGIPWLSFAPSDLTPATTGTGGTAAGYSTYTFSMTCAGFYYEVVDLIYRMERFQRAVVIDSIAMTPTTSILTKTYSPNLGLVQTQLSARTFTFASSGQQTGTARTP